jgi:hypothetical protein
MYYPKIPTPNCPFESLLGAPRYEKASKTTKNKGSKIITNKKKRNYI